MNSKFFYILSVGIFFYLGVKYGSYRIPSKQEKIISSKNTKSLPEMLIDSCDKLLIESRKEISILKNKNKNKIEVKENVRADNDYDNDLAYKKEVEIDKCYEDIELNKDTSSWNHYAGDLNTCIYKELVYQECFNIKDSEEKIACRNEQRDIATDRAYEEADHIFSDSEEEKEEKERTDLNEQIDKEIEIRKAAEEELYE